MTLEAVSKPRIRFEVKAPADEKAQSRPGGMSILRRRAIPPMAGRSGLRRGFEIASRDFPDLDVVSYTLRLHAQKL